MGGILEKKRLIDRRNIEGVNKKNRLAALFVTFLTKTNFWQHVEGQENLDKAVDLLRSGARVVGMGNHLSHGDGAVLKEAIRHRHRDIGEDVVFILGQRLKYNRFTRPLTKAAAHIDVWPTTIETEDAETKILKDKMNKEAIKAFWDVLNVGIMLIVYPEGTRSRKGKFDKFQSAATQPAALLPNTYILPFAVTGTERVLSPIKEWRLGGISIPRINHYIPIPHKTTIAFGEPIRVDDFSEEGLSNSRKRRIIAEKAHDAVASLLPASYGGTMVEMRAGKKYTI